MKRFDYLALFGIITFTQAGFMINNAAGRELAEVTLGNPFGDGWLLGHHQPESELDDVHDPIDFGPLTNNTASAGDDNEDDADDEEDDNGHGCKKCGHDDDDDDDNADEDEDDNADDEEEDDNANDGEDDEEEEGPVGAPNPDVGGTGDENPFDVLEEMFANMTESISALEERVAELADLQDTLGSL